MKKYFSYFKILFIAIGVLFIGAVVAAATNNTESYTRRNDAAPAQRVYDYADVLSDTEEEELEELIAKREGQIGCDIVLVTISERVTETYGSRDWDYCMMNRADDFYIDHNFGFNVAHGDGALLLDNWDEFDGGSWLVTGGKVYEHYSYTTIDKILDDVYDKVLDDPYAAYKSYVENLYKEMSGKQGISINPLIGLIGSVLVCAVFVKTHAKTKEGSKTTTETTYTENNSIKFNVKSDQFINKYVTSRVIPRSSGGGGGGRSSGRAGGHRHRSGARLGGGGRRR